MNNISYKNRGMFLENLLNNTNTYYYKVDKAVIFKKPTPIKVLHFNYGNYSHIDKAVFSSISTLDYNGIYRGKYIEFDAKETQNMKSFPLANLKEHQVMHIRKIIKHGGIIFLIIYMNKKYFLYEGNKIIDFIDNNTRKSIEYTTILKEAYEIKEGLNPSLDYLKIIDKIYFGGLNEN